MNRKDYFLPIFVFLLLLWLETIRYNLSKPVKLAACPGEIQTRDMKRFNSSEDFSILTILHTNKLQTNDTMSYNELLIVLCCFTRRSMFITSDSYLLYAEGEMIHAEFNILHADSRSKYAESHLLHTEGKLLHAD